MVFTYEGVCLGCGKKVEIEGPLCYNGMGVRCDECRDKPSAEPRNSGPRLSIRKKLWICAVTICISIPFLLAICLTFVPAQVKNPFLDDLDSWISRDLIVAIIFAILIGIVAILFLIGYILKKTRPEDSGDKP
jgi:DNA-directed RNA polymerase subunit RPC12/RpoP